MVGRRILRVLPRVVDLLQNRADQANHGLVVTKDADDVRPSPDLLVDSFQRVVKSHNCRKSRGVSYAARGSCPSVGVGGV